MGRLIVLAGVLLIVVGIGAVSLAGLAPLQNIDFNELGNFDQAKVGLCREGETLIEETGASSYTIGQGYSSTAYFYCEDSDGERREVTGQFIENMGREISAMFGGDPEEGLGGLFTGIFSKLATGSVICGVGFFLIILGVIVSIVTRPRNPLPTSIGGFDSNYYVNIPNNKPRQDPFAVSTGGTLQQKLKQLDEARDAGLISQNEYDRMRQQILDSLK